MLKKILAVLALLIGGLVIVIMMQPEDFKMSRSIAIQGSPEQVFPVVNDFHNWDAWSPWAKLDPAMQQTFGGALSGTGAIYSWKGNSEVGEGRMEITESRPNEYIKIKLDFFVPFEATNVTEFTFVPQDNQTMVTWTMSGKNNFLTKAFHLFVDMDQMLGAQFEQGLSQMKQVVEGGSN